MASSLPPIAAPVRRRWREVRVRILPGIAFACVAGLVLVLWHDYILPEYPANPAQTNLVTSVSTPMTLPVGGR